MVNFDYYRIFYFVVQYKSFTKAAEILNNNQPNITRYINLLEQALSCKLFIRTHRGVTLTPEGERLYEHVAAAYEQLYMGEMELAKDCGLESGLITIGASETALRLMLLDKLETFHEKYPHVRLRICNHSTPQAIAALESGLVDFAVVTSPLSIRKGFKKASLYPFQEILIGGPKYAPLASKVRNLEDLRDYPFISLGNDTGTRELYVQYFLQHGQPFEVDMEAATMDQILPMVKHNLGIGFYPRDLAQPALARGEIVQIRLAQQIPERSVFLVRETGRVQSIAVKKMMDALMS